MVAKPVWNCNAGGLLVLRYHCEKHCHEPGIERIRHAARVANIADYIEALPLTYITR